MVNGLMAGLEELIASRTEIKGVIVTMIVLILLISCNNTSNKSNEILGSWECVLNSDSSDFRLVFESKDNQIIGEHCFVLGEKGDKIDCPDQKSFIGISKSGIVTGEFKSDFEDNPIKCQISIVNDTLLLKPLSNTGFSLFYRNMKFLKSKE